MKKLLLGLLAITSLGLGACSTNNTLRGIADTYVNEDGYLVVVYTDGTEDIAGYVKGEQGETGPQGEPGEDGTDGTNGSDGNNGQDGVSIVSIVKTSSDGLVDTYTVTYSDGHTSTFTITNGQDGEDGQDGVSVEVIKKYDITIPEPTTEFRSLLTIENTFNYLALYHDRIIDEGIGFGPWCELNPPANYRWWNYATINLVKNNTNYESWEGKTAGYYIIKNAEITNITYNNNNYPTYTISYENIYSTIELLMQGE